MRNGYTPSKSNPAYWEGGTIPWFRMEDLRTSGRILEDSIQHITPEAVKGKGLFKAGSILMATTATIGEPLLIADSLANQQFTNFAIRESLMGVVTPMFAYYYFFLICEWCKRNVYESSFPSVDMKRLREVRFPIPPLAVQEEVVRELQRRFPDVDEIEKTQDKRAFVKLFGEYLRIDNVLQNFDEYVHLRALQQIDKEDAEAVESFRAAYGISEEELSTMITMEPLPERAVQNYRSAYNDIREWLHKQRQGNAPKETLREWDDVVFEVSLLKAQEIDLDYILELIFEHNKANMSKPELVEEIRRIIRASVGSRAKEELIVDFIHNTDIDTLETKADVIMAFFSYAQERQQREAEELIAEEGLNAEAARRYIQTSLRREYASDQGTDLNDVLPKMSPLNRNYLTKKQSVFERIAAFVEKFKGVGGKV